MLWTKLQSLLSMDAGDYLKHREAREHLTISFPATAQENPGELPGYFQVRLCEMRLSDDRRWLTEVAPAVLFVAAYHYDGKLVRHPHFISTTKVAELVDEGISGVLRIKFRNQLVFGPVPYGGGDVDLMVSLCQVTLKDWGKSMFTVFENVLGGGEGSALNSYLKVADRVLGEISKCLGGSGIQCILAEKQPIGEQDIPPASHIAFIANTNASLRKDKVVVQNDQLYEDVGGTLEQFSSADYCLIKIEQLAQRNDYTSLPFHQTWLDAQELMLSKKKQDAQVMMANCASQVFRSPDLTEPHKFQLIRLYQAKLIAIGDVLLDLTAERGLSITRASSMNSGGNLVDARRKNLDLRVSQDIQNLSLQLRPTANTAFTDKDISGYMTALVGAQPASREQMLNVITEQITKV